jgi:hypothetical protein
MRAASPIAVVSAVVLATLAPSAGFANRANAPGTGARTPVQRTTTSHKLANVTIDSADLDTAEPTGYTLIDTNTVTCDKPSCTIVIDISEQVGNAYTTGNWFAVCGEVDGTRGYCPYSGEIPSDGGYVNAHSRQTFLSVAKGTHGVGFYLFLGAASAYSDVYDVQYQVLTP